MSRNEFKEFIKSIITSKTIPEGEKEDKITEACIKNEQGYGGVPLRKLLNQIAKELNDEKFLASAHLLNEMEGIMDKHGFSESSELQSDIIEDAKVNINIGDVKKYDEYDEDDGNDDNDGDSALLNPIYV